MRARHPSSTPLHLPAGLAAGVTVWVAAAVLAMGAAGAGVTSAPSGAWVAAIKVLVFAPILEEVVFRGGLHAALLRRSDRWGHPIAAAAVTAAAFGVAHLWSAPWGHALAVMGPALLIGVVYHRTRSVGACVWVHMAMNAAWWIWSR